jgi:enoyl-CoA hydratase/carnithine racemase
MADARYEQIIYEVADPIATIKLNRPARLNAWTDRMGAEVKHALARAEQDERVVVIVLTGEGRGFCAGADLEQLQSIGDGTVSGSLLPEELEASPGDDSVGESFRGHYSYIMSIRKPVIAAINGPCAGWTLTRAVGPAHAMDLILSGRTFDAREAERLGVVNRVLPHAELLPFVTDYAQDMAANCSPTSMAIMKRQVYQDMGESLARANERSFELMLESFDRPDLKEGVDSFLQKRPARFQRI